MPPEAIYDEADIPEYTLPDLIKMQDGTPVTSARQWLEQRRPELLALFKQHVYGDMPAGDVTVKAQLVESSGSALHGKAIRKQVVLTLETALASVDLNLLIYLPSKRDGAVPAFLGLNFYGNHTVHSDPAINVTKAWVQDWGKANNDDHRATEADRGSSASRWPIERILERGYGLITLYCGELNPDYDDGFRNGVHALFARDDHHGDAWATISAWAWGLRRVMDYLESDNDIDAARIALMGHSRLGKTSLWAGANDPRFAVVISNDSGCGGAALSRRRFGECVARINTTFPHWFCTNFKQYNDNEDAQPLDQHALLALVAPRPLYVASAEDDLWADPHGEFLSAKQASPVYELLGEQGLPVGSMPPVNVPVVGTIAYHIRPGEHDVTAYDWERYMDFADANLK